MTARRSPSSFSTGRVVTYTFNVADREGVFTVVVGAGGQPTEVAVKFTRHAPALTILVRGFCDALSQTLQAGMPLHEAIAHYQASRIERAQHTHNPVIPTADAIVDHVMQWLGDEFIGTTNQPMEARHG